MLQTRAAARKTCMESPMCTLEAQCHPNSTQFRSVNAGFQNCCIWAICNLKRNLDDFRTPPHGRDLMLRSSKTRTGKARLCPVVFAPAWPLSMSTVTSLTFQSPTAWT